jgi:hypothetical protein
MIRKEVKSHPEVQVWLDHFEKVGLVIDHKEGYDEMKMMQNAAFQLLFNELELYHMRSAINISLFR